MIKPQTLPKELDDLLWRGTRNVATYEEAKRLILSLIEAEKRAASEKAALKTAELLDNANVPQNVKVPDIKKTFKVPLVDAEQWIELHKVLRRLRQFVDDQLELQKKGHT